MNNNQNELRTYEVEPLLFESIHDNFKRLAGDSIQLFLLPVGIDYLEPFLIYKRLKLT